MDMVNTPRKEIQDMKIQELMRKVMDMIETSTHDLFGSKGECTKNSYR